MKLPTSVLASVFVFLGVAVAQEDGRHTQVIMPDAVRSVSGLTGIGRGLRIGSQMGFEGLRVEIDRR